MTEYRKSRGNGAAGPRIILMVGVLLSGCTTTSTLTLKPKVDHLPNLGRVPLTVGVYHSPEFRAHEHIAESYGNKHRAVFPIGPASVTLFQEVYPKVFENVVPVETRPPVVTERSRLSALIEPRIDAFQFLSGGPRRQNWAEITYGFTLTSPGGDVLASWTVKGTGEGGYTLGRAVDLAMQDAAMKFMASFEQIPEAKRWLHGLPAEGATAPADGQVMRAAPGLGEGVVLGVYPGVVAVRAERNLDPVGRTADVDTDASAVRLLAIQVFVKNEGSHRLLLRRSDIALVSPDGTGSSPLPAPVFAAVTTARRLRIGPVAPGVGLAALPSLFVGLYNAAAIQAEKGELMVREKAYRSEELHDAILRKEQSVQGFVYFVAPPGSPDLRDLTLAVPVVGIDAATRYIVRLPLAGLGFKGVPAND